MTKSCIEIDEQETEERENRFAHLLQPIRDLSANWNIDLSKELEAYLTELEGIKFSPHEKALIHFNFSEAALLLQGSAVIYGRKVEHLHALVFQALQSLFQRRNGEEAAVQEDRNGAAEEHSCKRGASRNNDDEDDFARFMSVDDIEIADRKDINLGTSLEEQLATATSVTCRMPEILLAVEEDVHPGNNAAAGVFSSEIASFKTKSCGVHRSGALLLHLRDGDLLDEFLCPISGNSRAAAVGGKTDGGLDKRQTGSTKTNDMHRDDLPADHVGPTPADENGEVCAEEVDADDDVPGLEEMDFGGSPMGCDEDMGGGGAAEEARAGCEGPPRPFGGLGTTHEMEEEEEEEVEDPWEPLDPYDAGEPSQQKPIKKWEKGSRWKRLTEQRSRRGPVGLKNDPFPLAPPKKPLLYPEFAKGLQLMKLLQGRERDKKGDPSHPEGPGGMANAFPGDPQSDPVGAFNANEDGMCDGWDNDDDHFCGNDGGISDGDLGDNNADGKAWEGGEAGGSGSGEKADGLEETMFSKTGGGNDLDMYEDLCRAQIDAMLKSAAAAEVQSELAARVSDWKTKIEPVLETKDAHPVFDIHAYGERLLDRLETAAVEGSAPQEKTKGRSSFAHLVGGFRKCDVSRTFAAMLQLVNNGNIKLEIDAKALPCCFTASKAFNVRLLNMRKPHQEMLRRQALSPTTGVSRKPIPPNGRHAASSSVQEAFRPTAASPMVRGATLNAGQQSAHVDVRVDTSAMPSVSSSAFDGCLTQELPGAAVSLVGVPAKRQKKARTPDATETVSRSRVPCVDNNSNGPAAIPIRTPLTRAAAAMASPYSPSGSVEWTRLARAAAGRAPRFGERMAGKKNEQAAENAKGSAARKNMDNILRSPNRGEVGVTKGSDRVAAEGAPKRQAATNVKDASPGKDVENRLRFPNRGEARSAAKAGQIAQQHAVAVIKQTPEGKRRRKSQQAAG